MADAADTADAACCRGGRWRDVVLCDDTGPVLGVDKTSDAGCEGVLGRLVKGHYLGDECLFVGAGHSDT